MKLACWQANLSRGRAGVGRAVATRDTLPVTQNVLLSVDQSMLKLSATNLEIAMTTWVGAMIEEEGSITVPARLLTEFVNSLPNDKIDLQLDEGSGLLQISSGNSTAHINITDAAEFPPIPTVHDGVAPEGGVGGDCIERGQLTADDAHVGQRCGVRGHALGPLSPLPPWTASYTTLPGFMMFFGSSARLIARIRSTSTADL